MKDFNEALKGMLKGQVWRFGLESETLFKVEDCDLMIFKDKWVSLPAFEFDFYKDRDLWTIKE